MLNNSIERFPEPSEGQLQNIGVGCFVQIDAGDENCYWVEVDGEDDDTLTGVVHTELETIKCEQKNSGQTRVSFNRNQIMFLGCDRYCFC